MKLSIVIPCYNEEEALPLFLPRLRAAVDTLPDTTLELLLVDDGSTDGTLSLVRSLAEADACVRYLSFSRNFGKEAALYAGLSAATGDLVAVMDADMQDPPEVLIQMHALLLSSDCDCVACRRVTRKGEPAVRSFFARTFYRLINRVSPVRLEDGVRDFRLMRREVVDAVLSLSERRRFAKGLFAWVGFHVCYIEYENVERVAGTTKWSFWGLLRYALEGVFCMTALPLSLPLLLGALCLLAGLVLLCCGAWVAALLCAAAACVLAGLGMLGQYLARVYWEAKRRPLYILKRKDQGAA